MDTHVFLKILLPTKVGGISSSSSTNLESIVHKKNWNSFTYPNAVQQLEIESCIKIYVLKSTCGTI